MNVKNLTIGSILLGLLSVWASRAGGLVSDEQLLYALGCLIDFSILAGVVLLFAVISYGISWGATQAYKVLYHNRKTWTHESVKRKIYRCALYSGAGSMALCGSVFLLAGFDTQQLIVFSVFWTIGCLFVGFSSPLVWRWTFEKLLPRFNRYVSGKKEVEDDEHEALNRPTEKPE